MAAVLSQDKPISDNSAGGKTVTQQSTSLFTMLQQTAQKGWVDGCEQRSGFFDRQEVVNAQLQHCSYLAPPVKGKLK